MWIVFLVHLSGICISIIGEDGKMEKAMSATRRDESRNRTRQNVVRHSYQRMVYGWKDVNSYACDESDVKDGYISLWN